MFGLSRTEKEADAIYIILDLFLGGFKLSTWRVLSKTGMRYDEWYGNGWDDRFIVVMAAYAAAVGRQAGFSDEAVSRALKKYCRYKAYAERGDAMFHRTSDSNLLTHYEHLFAYVYELADVVRAIPDGNGGVVLGCSVDLDTVMDVFAEKYFNFPPLVAEFKLKPNIRETP
jgi:hypothetical protein